MDLRHNNREREKQAADSGGAAEPGKSLHIPEKEKYGAGQTLPCGQCALFSRIQGELRGLSETLYAVSRQVAAAGQSGTLYDALKRLLEAQEALKKMERDISEACDFTKASQEKPPITDAKEAHGARTLEQPPLPPSAAAEEKESENGSSDKRAKPVRALVVDDNEINLIVAAEMLGQFGLETDTAENGAAALEMLSEQDYDIVFMDHLMLGMDGVETTMRLRALPGPCATLPVIALTANASTGAKDYFLQNGMNDYLAKPIELPQLLLILEKWLPDWENEGSPAHENQKQESAYLRDLRIKLGLDTEAAMNRIGENESAYINVLRAFARTAQKKMDAIAAAAAEQDWDHYRVGVHGMKSSLANIGAVSLSQDARNLEQAVIQQNYAFIEGLTPSFCKQLSTLAAQIHELEPREKQKKHIPDARPADRKRLRAGLTETAALLEDLDADGAAHLLRSFAAKRYGGRIDSLLTEARRALELFDYDEAERLLGEVSEVL